MRSRAKRLAALAADRALRMAAPLFRRRGASGPDGRRPRVLVVRCDHIGDAAMATAVLEPVREALDAERVDVLVGPWSAPLFHGNPSVDAVLAVAAPWWLRARGAGTLRVLRGYLELPSVIRRIRQGDYDVGIDLRGDLRHIFWFLTLGGCRLRVSSDRTGGRALLERAVPHAEGHEVERNAAVAALVGAPAGELRLRPPALPSLSAETRARLDAGGARRGYVVLATQGSFPAKCWPSENAARLVELARDRLGLATVFVGGPADREVGEALARRAGAVDLAGRTSLLESLSVMEAADAVVSVDTGPAHLAALVGTPVVTLFGPTDPGRYAPWCAHRRVVDAHPGCACAGHACVRPPAEACMAGIGADEVVAALEDLLGARSPVAERSTAV